MLPCNQCTSSLKIRSNSFQSKYIQTLQLTFILISFLGKQSPHIYLRSDDSFEPKTIGQRQEVVCSISVPPDVDPDTIELGWHNEDDITNDTRVTVYKLTNNSSDNSSNSSTIVMTTVIQFNPLLENDEGTYSCFYSKMNESALFTSIRLHSFISM